MVEVLNMYIQLRVFGFVSVIQIYGKIFTLK